MVKGDSLFLFEGAFVKTTLMRWLGYKGLVRDSPSALAIVSTRDE
jgi:hypothetical protein